MHVALLDWAGDPMRPGRSGLSDIVWDLGTALKGLGEDVTVVGAYDRAAPRPPSDLPLYRLDRPKLWQRNIVGQVMTCFALTRALGQIRRPDVVFAPEYVSPSIVSLLRPELPTTFTTPGNIYERIAHGNPYDWSTTQVYKIAANLSARRCARVIALSEHMREWWERTGAAPERVAVVPLGVDVDLYRPSTGANDRVGIPSDEETILYAGRLSVEKNLPVLIEAVAGIAPERPRLRLRILGSGPQEAELRALVDRLGMRDVVLFERWMPREAVPDYYRASQVVVLPSTSEPLARVLLEAMACGAFVIGSRSGGTPDIVHDGENGLLVEPKDVAGWRRAIARAFDDPAWRTARAAAGQKMVREQLAWPCIARRLRDEVFAPSIREWSGQPHTPAVEQTAGVAAKQFGRTAGITMSRQQIVDWTLEPRLVHHLPLWFARRWRYRGLGQGLDVAAPVPVALTWDVEHDLGSKGRPDDWSACPPFLDWLQRTSSAEGWRTTLFVQGAIVEPLADRLRPLLPDHEIGVHGHFHELWGRQLWFLAQPAVSMERRRALLGEALAAFQRAGLPRPRSFRAPYLVCDRATLDLLVERGFELDSSASAYRGSEPIISVRDGIVRVPISGSPRPRLHRRWGIPTWAPYDHFDLTTFLFSSPERLLRLVREVLAIQDRLGTPRHLVLLAHTWDFADVAFPGCSSKNFDRYVERVRLLADELPIQFATLSELVGLKPAISPESAFRPTMA